MTSISSLSLLGSLKLGLLNFQLTKAKEIKLNTKNNFFFINLEQTLIGKFNKIGQKSCKRNSNLYSISNF
ncbi:MAG: hypothetical protein CMC53_00420 [Flavobacteriaceae bacterium]|nr:hypothetical protein [Flavobacteriaceae bacterium]